MNDWGLAFWVALGRLDLRPKAGGVGEAKEGDLTARDFARPPGKHDCWDEENHEGNAREEAFVRMLKHTCA